MTEQLIHFGKLSLLYENGFIRYIRAGEVEVVRSIYFALRDSNWVTAAIVRSDERISVTSKRFDISYTAINTVDDKEVFKWHVKIAGSESGEVEFSVDGEALAMYNRNRAGICVLHPIRETREKPLHVTRPDGTAYESKFPSIINPYQPFFDIRKMTWQLSGNSMAELGFDGDVFETEDQRNWGDTSFKTYSTPLSIPYPVMLKPGDKVSQRVRLKLVDAGSLSSDSAEDIEVMIDESYSKPFPKIGTEFPHDSEGSTEVFDLLKSLDFDHLRIELILSSSSWKEKLIAGLKEAELIGARPFVHLILSTTNEWDEFAVADVAKISKLALSPLDRKANVDELLLGVLSKARKLFPGIEIGAGFTSYFTELNRNRFDYSGVDFVIYPVTPQAHATDTHTVIENLPAQTDQIESANTFAFGKKIHVGPVSLKPRSNSDAKPGSKESATNRFDERQSTALAAGWMLGSIKYLAEGGADSITLFESHGAAGYLLNPAATFPVYNALLAIQKLKPQRILKSMCNEPLVVTSIVIESEKNQRHLVLINHTSSKKFVSVGDTLVALTEFEIQFISLNK